MVFIDSNIPMYLSGPDGLQKAAARALLDQLATDEAHFVTSVEVIQEILHRYVAIRRFDAIPTAVGFVLGICDEIFDVTLPDVLAAQGIVMQGTKLSARDALHIAVMQRESIDTILSFDRGFDTWPGIKRIGG